MNKDGVAIYIRLSEADEDRGRIKDESNSVSNQRELINRFLDSSEELALLPRREFVDDGFSGTSTDRPAFQDMIHEIRDGNYNICITKDFSRFARNYIETGDYLECVFPFLGVRYISINDNYDSNDYKGVTGGLEFALRSFVYDAYSKDLSAKVKGAVRQAAKKGKRSGTHVCYGYLPDPNRKGYDIIDPETAPIVRRIFDMALEGKSTGFIASLLNDEGIPTPAQYFRSRHPMSRNFGERVELKRWHCITVMEILDRLQYTGASVQGMVSTAYPGAHRYVVRPNDEWIIVKGAHEAIVSEDEFNMVQAFIHKRKLSKREVWDYPLKGVVYCGCCGTKAHRWNNDNARFYCCNGQNNGLRDCAAVRSPKMSDFEDIVFRGIREIIEVSCSGKGCGCFDGTEDEKRLDVLKAEVKEINSRKIASYERYVSGEISREAFLESKEELGKRMDLLSSEIAEIEKRTSYIKDASGEVSICDRFAGEKVLTREMVGAFVDRIEVFPDERVEIKWKFKAE